MWKGEGRQWRPTNAKNMEAPNESTGETEYRVSWCVSHLVELAPPGSYSPKLFKWSRANLPIRPKTWQYLMSRGTQKQFEVLRNLMARPDVERFICAAPLPHRWLWGWQGAFWA